MQNIQDFSKGKEVPPLHTIHNIRNILFPRGIMVLERWTNPLPNFFTVTLRAEGTLITANGKGSTPDFALASAYGEFMERLQNLSVLRFKAKFDDAVNAESGFTIDPREKWIPARELGRRSYSWMKSLGLEAGQLGDLLLAAGTDEEGRADDDFVSVPLDDVISGSREYMPYNLLRELYGTNGMSAGNTFYEAAVQGICELFERYVQIKSIRDNLIFYRRPLASIRSVLLRSMTDQLTVSSGYTLEILDCAATVGLPVIGVLLVKDDKYWIRWGCHPVFEIALERTLTELLQGRDIENPDWMRTLNYDPDDPAAPSNIDSSLFSGDADYPNSIFINPGVSPVNNFMDHCKASNEELYDHLIAILRKKKYNVLYRDVSYLGFPSYHFIIPQLSIWYRHPDFIVSRMRLYYRLNKAARNLPAVTDHDVRNLRSYLENCAEHDGYTLGSLLGLPISRLHYSQSVDKQQLLFMCSYYLGDYQAALRNMQAYIDYHHNRNRKVHDYYIAVRDYLKLVVVDHVEQADQLLLRKHDGTLLQKVAADLKDKESIFSGMPFFPCPDCDSCGHRDGCYYRKSAEVYVRIKRLYREWAGRDYGKNTGIG